jgi:hypothetical protein
VVVVAKTPKVVGTIATDKDIVLDGQRLQMIDFAFDPPNAERGVLSIINRLEQHNRIVMAVFVPNHPFHVERFHSQIGGETDLYDFQGLRGILPLGGFWKRTHGVVVEIDEG